MPGIQAQQLQKAFKRRKVVDDVSVVVNTGEIVGLLGPNGAGKTTTFNMVVGLVAPDSGSVSIDGNDVSRMPMHRRARHGLGYLPQDSSIFRKLTVQQNMLAVLELNRSLTRADREKTARATLEEFGLLKVADSLGETLSGGERRRAEIARSLLLNPRYILFDEPFAGIDPINIQELQKEISALRKRGLGILLTDHNVRDTLAICDRAYILAEGKILEAGTPEHIVASDKARAVYLGQGFSPH